MPTILLVSLLFCSIPTAMATGDVKINDFTATVTSGVLPLHVYFTGDVSGAVTGWHWKFTNEGTEAIHYSSANVTAVHTFQKPGVFDVQLDVWGPGGNDMMVKTAYITTTKAK